MTLYRVKGHKGRWHRIEPAPCTCGHQCHWYIKDGTETPHRAFPDTRAKAIKK